MNDHNANNSITNENIILCDMYLDLLEEQQKIAKQITENNDMLRQIDLFIKSIVSDEDNELKVFSPRNPANLYSKQIHDHKEKQNELETLNRSLYKEKNTLDERINLLKKVVKIEDINVSLKKRENKKKSDLDIQYELNHPSFSTDLDSLMNKEILEDKQLLDNNSIQYSVNTPQNRKNELSIQENEKKRIARDLHDTTVQNLTHSIHMLELASKYIDLDPIRAKLELVSITKCIRDTIDEMRDIIYDLRPMTFDDIGFIDLLKRMQYELQQKTEMKVEFDLNEIDITDDLILITLYRVIKECCWNAIKHSKGKNLFVSLKQNSEHDIDIVIQDDGVGIQNTEGRDNSYGLSIVKERISILAGTFDIEQKGTAGTCIHIHIPKGEKKIYDQRNDS